MATSVARPARVTTTPLPGRRFDHLFFSAMALLMLVTVFAGFAPTYYLAGLWHAPLPSRVIHVHGAVFSCWILLLVAQVSLVSARRVDIHRRLGLAGFLLACLMVIVGVLAAVDSLVRDSVPGRDAKAFFIVPITVVLLFATLVFFAYRHRSDSSAHKRLILIATIAILGAPIARLPIAMIHRKPDVAHYFSDLFFIPLIAYDLWSTRKLHRATIWGAALVIIVHRLIGPIAHTAIWHGFAGWVQNLAR
jgi:FtsH-binding integral membrane protein